MKKEEEIIKTYTELIEVFTQLSNQTDNLFLANKSKEFVVDFASQLAKYEKKDKSVYEAMIDNVKGDKTKFVYDVDSKVEEVKIDKKNPIVNKEDEYNNYIHNTIQNDKYLSEELNRLTTKLIEDLKNPNDTLIEVWVKNYKDFVVKNNLNEDYMIHYMMGVFQLYDINRNYVNDVEELYREIELESPELSEELKEDKKEIPEDKKEIPEDKKDIPEDKKEIPEDKKEIPEDKPEVPEVKTPKEKDNSKPIKIINTKKAFLNSGEKLGAGVAAIACLSTPIITPAILVAYMIYKLRKNYKYKNNDLQEFLEENGFDIDNTTNELYRMEGDSKIIITEKELEKEEYSHVKKELMQIGALRSGLIPEEYKKSKLLQVLMGLNPVKKLKDMKNKYYDKLRTIHAENSYLSRKKVEKAYGNKLEIEDEEELEEDLEEELKSGMRRL